MSLAEIIEQLPKLSKSERRTVREKLADLAEMDEGVGLCNEAALEAAQMLDQLEEEDARPS